MQTFYSHFTLYLLRQCFFISTSATLWTWSSKSSGLKVKKYVKILVNVLSVIYSKLMNNRSEDVQQTTHIQTKGAMIWGCVQTPAISLHIYVKQPRRDVGACSSASVHIHEYERARTQTHLRKSQCTDFAIQQNEMRFKYEIPLLNPQ